MKQPPSYTRLLRAAVLAFLQKTPEGTLLGEKILVEGLRQFDLPKNFSSLAYLLWGGAISALCDPEINQDTHYLMEELEFLDGLSPFPRHIHVNENFIDDEMTREERAIWSQCVAVVKLFLELPGELRRQRYQAHIAAIEQFFMKHTAATTRWEDEMIYMFILRQVAGLLTQIEIIEQTSRPDYVTMRQVGALGKNASPKTPERDLSWAQVALNAIAGRATLTVSYNIQQGIVVFSLH